MNAEQKRAILETLRQLSLTAYEIGRKGALLHEVLEVIYRKIEDVT